MTGSENQNYYFFTKKIKPEEFFKIKNKIEVYIDHNGLVQINGMGDIEKIRNLIRVKNKQKEEL